ncbi:adenylosuccinate synthetase [Candidatus Avelusimicrobium faecicola]|uniref:adenylosuccinate synthetase n=1 Tax=Candidatus Avelusimicrobium faecicola TaxID=3416205 RepID=UPI003D0FCFC0
MIDIVCGGQAGDEGKGKISAYLSYKGSYAYCVRVGGPNAGHTVVQNGTSYTLKNIPSGFLNPATKLVLGAGAYTKTEWLLKELEVTGTAERLIIDPHAVLITEEETARERGASHFMSHIGSVGTGLGQAVKDRIERRNVKFAKDEPLLKEFIQDVPELLNKALDRGEDILLEGTQGIKLSLLHGEYPFVTSRDTTAATFLGEAGLGPKSVRDVYVVFKPYITRVGPGPLAHEMTDEKELEIYHTKGHEIGSVSKRLRRIGAFEKTSASRAIMINNCTKIAITHIDMFAGNDRVKKYEDFTPQAKAFLEDLKALSREVYPHPEIALISTGPDMEDTLVL